MTGRLTRQQIRALVRQVMQRGVPEADAEDVVIHAYEKACQRFQKERGSFDALLASGELEGKQLLSATLSLHSAFRTVEDPTLQARMMESTEDGYDSWLEANPGHKNEKEIHYAFAEMLYKSERYEESFEHYQAVATKPSHPRATFCAMSSIYAAKKMIDKQLMRTDEQTDGTLNRWEQNLLTATDQFLELAPDDPQANGAGYNAAFIEYNAGRYEESREPFRTILESDPTDASAPMAANLIADSLVVQQHWTELEEQTFTFSQIAELENSGEMYQIAAKAGYRRIEVGENSTSADMWLSWLAQYPDADPEIHALAMKNTIVMLEAEGRFEEAEALQSPEE